MGIVHSRRRTPRTQVVTNSNNNAYRYPPKSENYFGSHFIMGGEKFESARPDAYLFGENEDLNFLGSKPTPFPYPVPQPHEPTKTLKSLVNIRRDSLRLVKNMEDTGHDSTGTRYNIEFTFDTDVKCAITIYYFAKEEITSKHALYHPRDVAMNSVTFHYKRGANQIFSQPTHYIEPSKFGDNEWRYNPEVETIPIVIQCVVGDGSGHSHMTFAVIEKSSDHNGYTVKALKQKQMVDGLCYLLQEIYGIENKNSQRDRQQQQYEDTDDNGSECVICMCEMRDTLILPCRHLCLCNSCADNLRYQANNCPICRAKFHALLQIKATRKKSSPPVIGSNQNNETSLNQDDVPEGYEAVPLIEALNGPNPVQPNCTTSIPTFGGTTDGSLPQSPSDVSEVAENASAKDNVSRNPINNSEEVKIGVEIGGGNDIENDEGEDDEDDDDEGNIDAVSMASFSSSSSSKGSIDSRDDKEAKKKTDFEKTSVSICDENYETPLHRSRQTPTNDGAAVAVAGACQNDCDDDDAETPEEEEYKLQIKTTGGSSDSSRYSSTKDLLEQQQQHVEDEENNCSTRELGTAKERGRNEVNNVSVV